MSRFRLTVSRLLAFGGFTALSGTTFVHYRYNLLGNATPTAECSKPAQLYEKQEIIPTVENKHWDDNWDLRGKKVSEAVLLKENTPLVDVIVNETSVASSPSNPKEPKPTATRHVILVRHGQYVKNDDDRFRILTELGRKQAIITGERLKSLGIEFDKMVVSTMTRAQETGSLIGESLPDIKKTNCSLLREGAPYPMEPKYAAWTPSERSFFQDNPRIEGAFRKYIHRADPKQKEDSYELLVCHANVIRYFVCRSLQFPAEGWGRMSIANCGVTWLSIRPSGRVSLRGLGDVGHLPPDLITYN